MASIAALALLAMMMTTGSVSVAAFPIEGAGVSLKGRFAKLADDPVTPGWHQLRTPRSLEGDAAATEEHDDHNHDEHENEDLSLLKDEHAHDHEDEEDGHEDHEVQEDHDDHGDHGHSAHEGEGEEHEVHEDHGDHDNSLQHDHGEEEFNSFSSSSENEAQTLPWGKVIGATLLINMAALSGVLIIVMAAMQRVILKNRVEEPSDTALGHGLLFDICIPAFAVGALLATAVFLIFPEALHLIEGGHGVGGEEVANDDHSGHGHRHLQEDSHAGHDDSSESANAAKFGCAILGGFLLPLVFSIVFHNSETFVSDNIDQSVPEDDELCQSCNQSEAHVGISVTTKVTEMGDTTIIRKVDEGSLQEEHPGDDCEKSVHFASQQESVALVTKTFIDKQLCASILLGDAFHNFADGVFIGAAFKSCSSTVAVSIVLVTLFHEIAQELADFVLLTRYAGLSIVKACALNFISGLSVCLGGIVFLAADPSDQATGIILAVAGGVYFNIAGCETIPRLEKFVRRRGDRVWTLFSIILGTVPIGLVLLNHQHCG